MGAPDIDVQEVIGSLSAAEHVLTLEPLSPGMVVVKYEEQLRTLNSQYWSKWTEIDEEQYKRNKENPIRFGWEYRVRRLFVEITEHHQ